MSETPKAPKPVETAVLFGIAKKMNQELEELTVYQHGAVVAMLHTVAQQRGMKMQDEFQRAQKEAQDDLRRAEQFGATHIPELVKPQ